MLWAIAHEVTFSAAAVQFLTEAWFASDGNAWATKWDVWVGNFVVAVPHVMACLCVTLSNLVVIKEGTEGHTFSPQLVAIKWRKRGGK